MRTCSCWIYSRTALQPAAGHQASAVTRSPLPIALLPTPAPTLHRMGAAVVTSIGRALRGHLGAPSQLLRAQAPRARPRQGRHGSGLRSSRRDRRCGAAGLGRLCARGGRPGRRGLLRRRQLGRRGQRRGRSRARRGARRGGRVGLWGRGCGLHSRGRRGRRVGYGFYRQPGRHCFHVEERGGRARCRRTLRGPRARAARAAALLPPWQAVARRAAWRARRRCAGAARARARAAGAAGRPGRLGAALARAGPHGVAAAAAPLAAGAAGAAAVAVAARARRRARARAPLS